MQLLHPDVDRYLHGLAATSDAVVLEMERLAEERSFPIVGPVVGQFLYVTAVAVGARNVLELGSGFGYSAYWFARAVGPEGTVVLTEASERKAAEARVFLERAGLGDRVRIEIGDALSIANSIDECFDIVFNDVDKEGYPEVLDLASARLGPGGLLISDNMLWLGKVLDPEDAEASTRGVVELTRRLYASREFSTTLVPLRDGVTVSVKLG